MTVEITSAKIKNRIVTIEGIDVSEENLQRMERTRDDGFEREVVFSFNLTEKYPNIYINRFLHRQKAVRELKPSYLVDALQAIIGTVTTLDNRYLDYFSVA